jgi:hypothetical protein
MNQDAGPHQIMNLLGILILDSPASRTVRNKYLLVYGTLL